MQKTDFDRLSKLLTEVAECYDKKPPTQTAITNWFEALYQFPFDRVYREIKDWIVTKPRFPTISDIYQPLNEQAIDEREALHAEQKAQEKREVEALMQGRNPNAKKMLSEMKALLDHRKPDPKAWAHKILNKWANGEPVDNHIQVKPACDALGINYKALIQAAPKEQRKQIVIEMMTVPEELEPEPGCNSE